VRTWTFGWSRHDEALYFAFTTTRRGKKIRLPATRSSHPRDLFLCEDMIGHMVLGSGRPASREILEALGYRLLPEPRTGLFANARFTRRVVMCDACRDKVPVESIRRHVRRPDLCGPSLPDGIFVHRDEGTFVAVVGRKRPKRPIRTLFPWLDKVVFRHIERRGTPRRSTLSFGAFLKRYRRILPGEPCPYPIWYSVRNPTDVCSGRTQASMYALLVAVSGDRAWLQKGGRLAQVDLVKQRGIGPAVESWELSDDTVARLRRTAAPKRSRSGRRGRRATS
jgi:hypothetical protein